MVLRAAEPSPCPIAADSVTLAVVGSGFVPEYATPEESTILTADVAVPPETTCTGNGLATLYGALLESIACVELFDAETEKEPTTFIAPSTWSMIDAPALVCISLIVKKSDLPPLAPIDCWGNCIGLPP